MIRLRDITPRGLYARSLLMLLAPVALILALMTWYYYNSHIAEVNRKLGQSVSRDASLVQAYCERTSDEPTTRQELENRLDVMFVCDYDNGMAYPDHIRSEFSYMKGLKEELETRLGTAVALGMDTRKSELDIRFQSDKKTTRILIERKRALTINSHFFIVWVILSSLVMVALAIGFLNQQVRSILRLSNAAKAFGRGREAPGFHPSGATEIREAARSVLDMKSRLTAFADQRTAMLAGVSHDLRTPLTRLKLALAMMDQTDDITAARGDLDDMAAMLDEYLAFASGEEGDDPQPLNIAELVRSIASSFGTHVDVSGPQQINTAGRALGLKRAISNLISNGLKYATDVRVTMVNGPHAVDIHIDDNGPGIPRERREEAFRPFARLAEGRTQNTPGTGLGLTLARDTARAHGGDVMLSVSSLGGLRATLRLPH